MSGRSCSAGRIVFFEAQSFGVNESPHSPHIGLDPACSQLLRQLAQGERPRTNALAQPVGIGTGQNPLLVTTDLAGRDAPSLPPQVLPLRHTGRTDLKLFCDRTDRLTRISPPQSTFANIFRKRSRHPCWPPFPSTEFEPGFAPAGNPQIPEKDNML